MYEKSAKVKFHMKKLKSFQEEELKLKIEKLKKSKGIKLHEARNSPVDNEIYTKFKNKLTNIGKEEISLNYL
jgi:hypothetical protein